MAAVRINPSPKHQRITMEIVAVNESVEGYAFIPFFQLLIRRNLSPLSLIRPEIIPICWFFPLLFSVTNLSRIFWRIPRNHCLTLRWMIPRSFGSFNGRSTKWVFLSCFSCVFIYLFLLIILFYFLDRFNFDMVLFLQLQPVDFNGKELSLKLHPDGRLGGFESSSGTYEHCFIWFWFQNVNLFDCSIVSWSLLGCILILQVNGCVFLWW